MLMAQWTSSGIEAVDQDPTVTPDGWVRLRVSGCGICGSDLHVLRGLADGLLEPADFATPGHEIAGTIVDGPAGLDDVVYAVEPWLSCTTCAQCLQGEPVVCEQGQLFGFSTAGGLAEYVDVPPRLLHPVGSDIEPGLASLAEPWAVAVRAVHRARLVEVDERVLVLGGGTIGLMCGVAARSRAARVGVTCRYPHQASLAERFGLDAIAPDELDLWADEHRPGVVIETVGGEADTMADATRAARPRGRIVVVGVFGSPRPTDYRELVLKELEVVGSFIYGTVGRGSEFRAAVDRMPAIQPELSALQTHHFALAEVAQAFEVAQDKTTQAVKITIGG